MGALLSCFSEKEVRRRAPPPRWRSSGPGGHAAAAAAAASAVIGSSNRWGKARSGRKERGEEALIQEQALAAALLLQQTGVQLPFDRSSSLRYPAPPGGKKQALPRSSSSRARSLTDPPLQPQQLVNQDLKIDDLETSHFVLVHGGGFGAWCWYKTIVLLEECGFKVTAVDLTGSGVHSFDTNHITSLSQYVKPLADFLEKLADGEKVYSFFVSLFFFSFTSAYRRGICNLGLATVNEASQVILVGHDFGGACISYAMEIFPSKIAKAVFISAAMLKSGQSTLDMFSQQVFMLLL
ncbi:hypothetical protein Taro_005271 [Colocasia esculenta]|uniref:AB hydrolase-1 domain-containing protein n=1 Tax=Colocasia esculenta TaxID=4460 RepID=A0A843TXC3_COLES|nr:hypothetical protein [Colocasia esculenta]